MAVTAGALSKVAIGKTTDSLLSAVATAGTGPYTYQWYRSTTTGFSPGAGNLISGATSLSLSDSGLLPATTYFYKVVATDTGAGNATSTSAQLQVDTAAADPDQNQFQMSTVIGSPDMRMNLNSISVIVDSSQVGSIVAGQAVKIVDNAGGVPKVISCSANADQVLGFVNYNIKQAAFVAGSAMEISLNGNVMYLISSGAIARGAQVTLDVVYVGGVAQLVGSSGARIVGYALDKVSGAGQLLRVMIQTPSFAVA